MPCSSSHLAANRVEQELDKVEWILDELETGTAPNPKEYGTGYRPGAYGKDRRRLDERTRELCARLQDADIASMSLEAQVWWRGHQAADARRLKRELEARAKGKEHDTAIAKLTPRERTLLGLA